MSVYNGEAYLEEAIESVLRQSFTDFEFIIFDDCSRDKSLEIIRSYDDQRIICISNRENKGLTINLQAGMKLAKGEFLARMDADDVCLTSRFEKQVNFLKANPDISILGTAVTFFNDNYTFIGYQPLVHEEIKVELLLGYTMMHPSVMMRLKDFHLYDLNYDPHFKYSQDYDLWTRSIRKLKFANLAEPLIKMREHTAKISRTLKPQQKIFSDEVRQKQLQELEIEFSAEELKAFNSITSGVDEQIENFIEILEVVFNRIIYANYKKRIFDQAQLQTACARLFRQSCRQKLLMKDKAGLNYWFSSLRKNDSLTLRQTAGMIYHSVAVFSGLKFRIFN